MPSSVASVNVNVNNNNGNSVDDLSTSYTRRLLANLNLLREQNNGSLCDVELVPGWISAEVAAASAQPASMTASNPFTG